LCPTSAFFGGGGKFVNFFGTGDELFEVMQRMETELGVHFFYVRDENFLLHRKCALALLDRGKEAGKMSTMSVFASANAIFNYTMQEPAGYLRPAICSSWRAAIRSCVDLEIAPEGPAKKALGEIARDRRLLEIELEPVLQAIIVDPCTRMPCSRSSRVRATNSQAQAGIGRGVTNAPRCAWSGIRMDDPPRTTPAGTRKNLPAADNARTQNWVQAESKTSTR
jgi:hypothetical protein